MNSLYTEKTIRYGTTGIAGSGHKHIYLPLALLTDKVTQQTCHKTAAYILKRECRAMKQFKRVNAIFHMHQWHIKIQRIVNNLFQGFCRDIFTKESISHTISNLLERKRFDRIIKFLWQRFDRFGHKKPLIGSKALHYGFFKCSDRYLTVSAVIFHNLNNVLKCQYMNQQGTPFN